MSVYSLRLIYHSTLKICRVELYTELFYAIIPTLFPCFLLICFPYVLMLLVLYSKLQEQGTV